MKRAKLVLMLMIVILTAQDLFPQLSPAINVQSGSRNGFEPNFGQVADFNGQKADDVIFRNSNDGFDIFVTKTGISYVIKNFTGIIKERGFSKNGYSAISHPSDKSGELVLNWARVDLDLLNANIKSENIEYSEQVPGYSNYYYPHTPEGVLFVPAYKFVKIKNVYPGIDWVWKIDSEGILHHEFEVSESADYKNIQLKVKWADVKVSNSGHKVNFATPAGVVEDGEIMAYDNSGSVNTTYKYENNILSYSVNSPVSGKLVIDPPLARLWATFYGGGNNDYGKAITTDQNGNVFLAGYSLSSDFPTQNPGDSAYFQGTRASSEDAFIIKFNNLGVRQWATYYGGTTGSRGLDIKVNSLGEIFVSGRTGASDFPVYNPGGGAFFQGTNQINSLDGFILKFNNAGVRRWATLYGGSGTEEARAIAFDNNGNIYVTGVTNSSSITTLDPGNGAYFQGALSSSYDGFILKFNSSLALQWATYYGGNGLDLSNTIVTDSLGNVFISGSSNSTDFPVQDAGNGAYFQSTRAGDNDIFICKFNNTGVRQWATYYGGNLADEGLSMTRDRSGNIFLTGKTASVNTFPVFNPGDSAYFQGTMTGTSDDIFILKFSNSGVRQWATFYGSNGGDRGLSITSDLAGNIYVTGETTSSTLPRLNPGGGAYYQTNIGGGSWDAYILKFANNGVRQWATHYGGSGDDYGYSVATDQNGNIFVSGFTTSSNFPLLNAGGSSYYQSTRSGTGDGFILKFDGVTTSVKETGVTPSGFVLDQNYPNPFNPSTRIRWSVPEAGHLSIKVYDVLGNEVASIVDEYKNAGSYEIDFDAGKLSSGVYLYKLQAGNFVQTRKMILAK